MTDFRPVSQRQLRELKKLHQKKYREQDGLFFAEGYRNFLALRQQSLSARMFIIQRSTVSDEQFSSIAAYAAETRTPLFECDTATYRQISAETTPPGIYFTISQNRFLAKPGNVSGTRLMLYFDGISDPGNLGTIIRTAAWFGVNDLIFSPNCVDPFNPKAVRATAGAIFSCRLYLNFSDDALLRLAQQQDFRLAATVPSDGTALEKWHPKEKTILLLGSEAHGLREILIQKSDTRVTIPGDARIESLNLAVSAGILLYHTAGELSKISK
jgi:TrmH family RNA methyltransferase